MNENAMADAHGGADANVNANANVDEHVGADGNEAPQDEEFNDNGSPIYEPDEGFDDPTPEILREFNFDHVTRLANAEGKDMNDLLPYHLEEIGDLTNLIKMLTPHDFIQHIMLIRKYEPHRFDKEGNPRTMIIPASLEQPTLRKLSRWVYRRRKITFPLLTSS